MQVYVTKAWVSGLHISHLGIIHDNFKKFNTDYNLLTLFASLSTV